ncbi:MAG: DNA-directed RNA polymerase subunit omega [Gammaproteobacteria bacterium]|nr:DNA-directed RNA polymerase subunit omega [Gammaproteobacteria bacterium]
MARITVDDCLKNVKNRFELVHIAAVRARQLDLGGRKTRLEENDDRSTLIALREIAEGHINSDVLYNQSADFSGMLDDGQDIGEAIRQVAQKELEERKEREEQEELERIAAEEQQESNPGDVPRKRGRPSKKVEPEMAEDGSEASVENPFQESATASDASAENTDAAESAIEAATTDIDSADAKSASDDKDAAETAEDEPVSEDK